MQLLLVQLQSVNEERQTETEIQSKRGRVIENTTALTAAGFNVRQVEVSGRPGLYEICRHHRHQLQQHVSPMCIQYNPLTQCTPLLNVTTSDLHVSSCVAHQLQAIPLQYLNLPYSLSTLPIYIDLTTFSLRANTVPLCSIYPV